MVCWVVETKKGTKFNQYGSLTLLHMEIGGEGENAHYLEVFGLCASALQLNQRSLQEKMDIPRG